MCLFYWIAAHMLITCFPLTDGCMNAYIVFQVQFLLIILIYSHMGYLFPFIRLAYSTSHIWLTHLTTIYGIWSLGGILNKWFNLTDFIYFSALSYKLRMLLELSTGFYVSSRPTGWIKFARAVGKAAYVVRAIDHTDWITGLCRVRRSRSSGKPNHATVYILVYWAS